MHRLDAYAHASRLRHVHPLNKFAFALTVIALCLVLDRPAVSAAALLWMAGLSLLWGGATPGFVLRLLAAEGLFLALGVVAVAVQIGPVGQGGGWSATVTPASLAQAGALLLRAFACASAMNFLALTTPILELAAAAQRFHAPAALLDVTLMMYRSVFLLLETLMRMQRAQESRNGYASWSATMRSAAALGSQLFAASWRSGQRMEMALQARGYEGGALPMLTPAYTLSWTWPAVACLVLATLLGLACL
ncbi:cobalt ECF transporter T component CbiQ [Caldilinea sp.]|jgi:cobalt/nickel transport system permease protein|uniref:cobalt ECF transporter T component CbiQ n=1 Tax=Caldilinea sp. TaxID=2293560 RepID=UPI0021DD3026|nr:cobalt ECF transporter T component CbiQ [Caldilinea sp.]GIV69434.1 MAG: cobalt ECF transporter T component CbiQ [Caldilinea sp.]